MKKVLCVIFACCLLCLSGCAGQREETVLALGTEIHLRLWGSESKQAVKELSALASDMEKTWSATNPNSALSSLEKGGKASEEMKEVLSKAEGLSQRTKGAFDPKLYAFMELWGFQSAQYYVPSQQEIDGVRHHREWDLNACIRGYAAQAMAQWLENMDITHALLDFGTGVQTVGNKPDGTAWSVGIANPAGGEDLGAVSVEGTMSVFTAGDYQQYFEQDGVRYHHILDPLTGAPAQSGLSSVTVISQDGMTADALSTALFVLGLEQGTLLWKESDDFEAVFVTTQGEIYATQGVVLSGCKYKVINR